MNMTSSPPGTGKRTRLSRGLLAATALGFAALAGSVYLKVRNTDRIVAQGGIYSGMGYPNATVPASKPLASIDRPAALVARSVSPVRILRRDGRRMLVDFGKTAFGALRFNVRPGNGTAAPMEVRLGELLAPDGSIHQPRPEENSRARGAAFYRRQLFAVGGSTHLVEGPPRPRPTAPTLPAGLTSLFPFRYAEIAGGAVDEASIVQIAVQYPFSADAASFHSSDPALNRVWDFSAYSVQATTYAGLYVDGNRERTPYEADAYINQLGHFALDSDYRLARHTLEYLLAHPTWPTEWMMFPVLIAHNDFLYSGDTAFLRRIYPALKARALTGLERADGLISTRGPEVERLSRALGLAAPMEDIVDWPLGERDGYAMEAVEPARFAKLTLRHVMDRILATASKIAGFHNARLYYEESAQNALNERYRLPAVNTVVNAFHYATLTRLAELARVLGERGDADRYGAAARATRGAMLAKLYDAKTGLFLDGEGSNHSSAHANLFPMAFGIVPPERRGRIADFLAAKGMAVSVYGAQFLIEALYAGGKSEAALRLLTANTSRSWIGMMARTGSTITTEAWNETVKPNQDWNHAWGTAPTNLIARRIMGIQPLTPGFERFEIRPRPDNLTEARIRLPSVKGHVTAAFALRGNSLVLETDIPLETRAEIYLPAHLEGRIFTAARVNGQPVPFTIQEDDILFGVHGPGKVTVEAVVTP